jgi:nicotinate phosphoribosyltransferase
MTMNDRQTAPIQYGPVQGEGTVSSGLDFYKPTMSQVAFEKHQEAEVTFTFKNRGKNKLTDYVDAPELQARLDTRRTGWNADEIASLASLTHQDGTAIFSEDYLDYLTDNPLPAVDVTLDEDGDIAIESTGAWPMVTFWETVVMSEINELYFENMIRREEFDLFDIYDEGNRRLDKKIQILQSRPDIQFADFGTRRRFSYKWQNHVIGRLLEECPENFVGTSNVYLAHTFDVPPIGTFAHEMPMVYAGLADKERRNPLDGHNEMLHDWVEAYGDNLSVALTDTFGSEYFFTDFTVEQAEHWKSLRHDSGDPIAFGDRVIEFYEENGINPLEKTIVFSDGLDIDTIVILEDTFKGRINVVFGWGTTLTNGLGLKTNNVVMKATIVDGIQTVKLSDDAEKHTGPEDLVGRYQNHVAQVIGKQASRYIPRELALV